MARSSKPICIDAHAEKHLTPESEKQDRALVCAPAAARKSKLILERHLHGVVASKRGLPRGEASLGFEIDNEPDIDEPITSPEGDIGALGELLDDPMAEDAYQQLLDHSETQQVRALLGSLNDRERTILRARYWLDGPEQSLREVGERIGLSGERVRQIEDRALGKLRASATRAGDETAQVDSAELS